MTSLLRACCVGVFAFLLAAGASAQTPAQAPPEGTPPQGVPPQGPPPQAPPPEALQEPQEPPPDEAPPGYIMSVEGAGVLERAATTGDAITGMPLLVGDRLRSEGGRLEIKWAESSELRLARYTDVDVLSRSMIRVPRGRVTVILNTAPGQSAHDQLAIDAPGASVRFYSAGEYLVSVGGTEGPEVELAVIRGSAQLASDRGQLVLAEGERSIVREGSAPSAPQPSAATAAPAVEDAYDPSDDIETFQRSDAGGAYEGTSYLPTELYGYESVLGAYGSWQPDPTYGHVWYPRVAADWRPYYRGRWHHVPRYGWTWLGFERWSWPTHHYGRWGFSSAGRWFWVPSRKFGPAWVSWAVAPSYVGWCPLGWDGRPVFGFASFTSVHVARGYDPWRGWTVIPSHRFGRHHDVFRSRVDHRVLVRERPAFITTWGPPRRHPGRGVVVERGAPHDVRGAVAPRTSYPPQRVRGSGPVPPSAGYSGYYPGGYRGEAIPREREESPYDRALRVMNRRGNDDNGNNRNDQTLPPGGVAAPPGSGARPGARQGSVSTDPNARGGYAYPRYGVPARQPQGDTRRTSPSNDDSDNGRGVQRGVPYRHAPGASRPPSSDDAPGMSRPRSDEGARRPMSNGPTSNGWSRPDSGDRGDRGDRGDSGGRGRASDGGGRPSGGGGAAMPRHGGGDRGGSSDHGARAGGDRGGADRGGRSGGGERGGSDRGGSDRGGRSGGGAVPRHPR